MRKQSHQSKHACWGLHSVPAHPTLKLQLYTASLNNIQNDKWHYKPDIHHQSFFKEHPSSIMHVWIMWNQELPDSFTQPPASWCCLNDTCQPVFSQLPNLKKKQQQQNNQQRESEDRRARSWRGGRGGEGRKVASVRQPTNTRERTQREHRRPGHRRPRTAPQPRSPGRAAIPAALPPRCWRGRVINDTCHSVRREGWVRDGWPCWKGNRLFGTVLLFSARI